jgi:hypothetical protein
MPLDQLLLSAARIVWRQRSLWVLGLLATAGTLSFNLFFRILTLRWRAGTVELDQFDLQEALELFTSPATLIGFVLALFLLAILFWLLNTVAEGSLIVAARGVEEGRPLTLSESLRRGLGLIGRFVGIDTLLFLPVLFLTLALMLVGFGAMVGLVLVATRPAVQAADLRLVAGLTTAVSAPILLLMLLSAIIIMVMRTLAFRAAALEGLTAGASIRRAWRLLRRKALPVTLMALVLWALRSVVGMPLRLASFALVVAGLGQFTLAASGTMELPAAIGAILSAAGLIVALLSGLLAAIMNAFASTSWTMGYGQWSVSRGAGEQRSGGAVSVPD